MRTRAPGNRYSFLEYQSQSTPNTNIRPAPSRPEHGSCISKTTVTTVQFTGVTVALNGRTHQLPDGLLIFDPSALATPTTTFDSTYAPAGRWVTTLNPNALSDEIFFDGNAIPVDSTISTGGKSVISYTIVSSDQDLVFSPRWNTANFTSWPGNAQANVLPYHPRNGS
jgi:hypothetical protein